MNPKIMIVGFLGVVLMGCAAQPEKDDGTPITVNDVKANPTQFVGRKIRWAGNIVAVSNNKNNTVIEVLGKSLNVFGNANDDGRTQGRFYARFAGFKDPAKYAKGDLLLVEGVVNGLRAGNIGAYKYSYPEIIVSQYKLTMRSHGHSYGPAWAIGWGWGRHGRHIGVGWGY